jgi:sialic acid synthase SpsE
MKVSQTIKFEMEEKEFKELVDQLEELEASRCYPTVHIPDLDVIYRFTYQLLHIRRQLNS